MRMKKIGAELILTVIIIPVIAWMITSIISLQNSYAELSLKTEFNKEMLSGIKEDVEFIRQKLMEKQ